MDRVVSVFAEVLRLPGDSLSDDTSPDNTPKWDSLSAITLVTALEDEFGVSFTTREIMAMRSVGFVKKVLRTKGVADV